MRSSDISLGTTTIGLVVAAVVLGVLIGVASTVAALPVAAAVAAAVTFVAIVARPRQAVVILALASPLYNLVIFRIAGVADLRILEVLWLFAVLGLLGERFILGRKLQAPPRFFIVGLCALAAWYFVSAAVTGTGISAYVESFQIAYLVIVGYVTASVFASVAAGSIGPAVRVAAVIATVVLAVYAFLHLAGLPGVPSVTIHIPAMFVEVMQEKSFSQQAVAAARELSRLSVLSNGVVETGALMAAIIPLSLGFVLSPDTPRTDRRIGTLLIAASSVVMLLTYSRAAWLICFAAVLWLLFRAGSRRAIAGILVAGVAVAAVLTIPSISARLQEVADPRESSYQVHQRMWLSAITMAQRQPVFGFGPGQFAKAADSLRVATSQAIDISGNPPHNWVLELAADVGWTGAAIGVVFVTWLLATGWLSVRRSALWQQGLWVAVLTYTLMNLTLNTFRTETTWVWFGLLAAIVVRDRMTAQQDPAAAEDDESQ